jgi:hypothetical protein
MILKPIQVSQSVLEAEGRTPDVYPTKTALKLHRSFYATNIQEH